MFSKQLNGKCQTNRGIKWIDVMRLRQKRKLAFTLIELLVVIAIIALLLSIITPALKRIKEAGRRVACLSNVKQLTLAWVAYTHDIDGRVVDSVAPNNGGPAWVRFTTFTDSPELQLEKIRRGQLYPYCENVEAYRCPSAKEEEGLRTYCMTQNWGKVHNGGDNGAPTSLFLKKITSVRNTAVRSVTVCNVGTDHNASFNVDYNDPLWINIPNWRHDNGTAISFADGHAEHWRWENKELTVEIAQASYEWCRQNPNAASRMQNQGDQSGNTDLRRIQKAVWGELGYTP